ncbi:MAG TPA: hypothetical protein VKG89_04555 [Solirubrobacterales bacterium]|nr:hypothetical protein [Solirubrobacterales bacterium]
MPAGAPEPRSRRRHPKLPTRWRILLVVGGVIAAVLALRSLIESGSSAAPAASSSAPAKASPSPSPAARPVLGGSVDPRSLRRAVPEIARRVEGLRGLRFESIPKLVVSTPQGLAERRKRAEHEARSKVSPAEWRRAKRANQAAFQFLRLIGLADPSFGPKQLKQVGPKTTDGLYENTKRRITVVMHPGESPALLEQTLAHELDHALDAQHFPGAFHRRADPSSTDAPLALSALVEGTATVIESRYAHHYLGARGPVSAAGSKLFGPENMFSYLPPALAAESRFPYTSGADFVRSLHDRGHGWAPVNRAFRRPPTTTAEILHPQVWPGRDPQGLLRLELAGAMPSGWRKLAASDSGELDARVILATGAPAAQARHAASGLDRGWSAAWQRRGSAGCNGTCSRDDAALLAYEWQSGRDAVEFAHAVPLYLTRGAKGRPAGRLAWRLPHRYAALALFHRRAAIGYAPTAALARRLAQRGVLAPSR